MTTIASDSSRDQIEIAAGVDTHQDTHTVAAVDAAGRLLGHSTFPATGAGYHALLAWLHDLGVVLVVGIEGTGAYTTTYSAVAFNGFEPLRSYVI